MSRRKDQAISTTLTEEFISSIPQPKSTADIAAIKQLVKAYLAAIPAIEGAAKPSLARFYHLLALAKGYTCWDAMQESARKAEPVSNELESKTSAIDKQMQFVEAVMMLAEAANHEDREIMARLAASKGETGPVQIVRGDDLRVIMKEERPAEVQLRGYLKSLTDDDLRHLTALMYTGRGDGSYLELKAYTENWPRENCLGSLRKGTLAKNLKKGLQSIAQSAIQEPRR